MTTIQLPDEQAAALAAKAAAEGLTLIFPTPIFDAAAGAA
jgi:hypothetical protein